VRRVADQGRGATEVAGQDLRDRERDRRDPQLARDGEGHRQDVRDRRQVVQGGRHHSAQEADQEQEPQRPPAREARGAVRRDRADQHHGRRAEQRGRGAVDPVGHDRDQGGREDRGDE